MLLKADLACPIARLNFFVALFIFRYRVAEVCKARNLFYHLSIQFTLGTSAFLLMTIVFVFFTLIFMPNSYPVSFMRVAMRWSSGPLSKQCHPHTSGKLTFRPPIETPSSGSSALIIISVNRLKRNGRT